MGCEVPHAMFVGVLGNGTEQTLFLFQASVDRL